ncbi:MAG: hypothetical protein KC684_07115 [Candidatus Omnitrophica bacterium]|nr:hypothetical protein [Candidatus Omnitrophota bacterium]
MKTGQELARRVHHILIEDWDPIGVKDIPQARDEYDSFVPSIISLLNTDVEEEQLFEILMMTATENMGTPRTDALIESSRTAAQKLMTLKLLKEN